jgi:hypothetical protein
MKRSGVEQAVNAFAHGQTPVGVLARDIGLAAHLFRQFDAAVYLVNFQLPTQMNASEW